MRQTRNAPNQSILVEPDRSTVSANQTHDSSASGRRWSRGWVLICGLLALLAAFVVWNEVLKYHFIAKRFGVVVPGRIYRSGQISKWMIEPTIEKHDIAVVIDMNGLEPRDEHQAAEIHAVEKLGVRHHRFPLSGDGTGDIRRYADAIETLVACERDRRPVLVHCAAGAQRTGGVVAAYRVLVQGRSSQSAYAELQRYGWRPVRNEILLTYLNGHMRQLAALLVERGVIDEIPRPVPLIEP